MVDVIPAGSAAQPSGGAGLFAQIHYHIIQSQGLSPNLAEKVCPSGHLQAGS